MAEAGVRFETYVRMAMREAGDMSLAELARRSRVKERSWHDWFRGTHKPRPNSLMLAGQALGRTPKQLIAVWDGDRPRRTQKETPPGGDQTALVAAAIDRQTEALTELLAPLVEEQGASVRSNSELLGRLLEQVLQADARLSALERTRG